MAGTPEVELYQHPWPMVLVPWPSGVTFIVQGAGKLIRYMSVEGISLPLNTGEALSKKLYTLHPGCCVDVLSEVEGLPDALTKEEADAIDQIFQETHTPLQVDRDRLKGSTEAWVHVHILSNSNLVLKAFGGRDGVFVWENCD